MSANPTTPTAHPTYPTCLITVGPAPDRDQTCTICIDDILPTDASVSHITCGNATHEECFTDLIAYANRARSSFLKCPSCQEICPSRIASRPTGQSRYVLAAQGILDAALAEGPPDTAPRPLRYLSERRLDRYFKWLGYRLLRMSVQLRSYMRLQEQGDLAAILAVVHSVVDSLIGVVTEAIHRERENGRLRIAEWLHLVAVLLERSDVDDEIYYSADEMLDTDEEEYHSAEE